MPPVRVTGSIVSNARRAHVGTLIIVSATAKLPGTHRFPKRPVPYRTGCGTVAKSGLPDFRIAMQQRKNSQRIQNLIPVRSPREGLT